MKHLIRMMMEPQKTLLVLLLLSGLGRCALADPVYNSATGHWYDLVDSGTDGSWISAENNAIALGGHLVTINDATEEAWLQATFGTSIYWIGFTDAAEEGIWVWSSGEAVTYTNWRAGEPNNSIPPSYGENYAVMNWSGQWNDWDHQRPGYTYCYGIVEFSESPEEADLVVEDISVWPNPAVQCGGKGTVSWTVENVGEAVATPVGYWVSVRLSTDSNYDQTDALIGRTQINEELASGDTMAGSYTLDPNAFEPGNYYLVAMADDVNDVVESAEANNTKSLPVTIAPASVECKLTVSSTEGGSVQSPGEGIFVYDDVEMVSVSALADAGWAFDGWSGTAVDAGKVANPSALSTTVIVDGDYTLHANFVSEAAPELPDLAISAEDIQLLAYDASDSTITIDAAIHNVGTATASAVTVRFYEFNTLLAEAEVVDIPAGEMRSVPITIAMPAAGERLIQVILDPLDTVEELDETNNEATQILLINTGDLTEGHILITGSVPSSVCSGSSFSVTGSAVYDLYADGVRYTDYAVKGGLVEMTVIGPDGEQWLYGGDHTNIYGAFSHALDAPEALGIYQLIITVTDSTFISERSLVFEVKECSSSTPPPGPPYHGPGGGSGGSGGGGGSGYWVPPGSGSGGGGSAEWTWVWTERPPGAPDSDVYVYSENIHFSVNHPDPEQEITIFAEIRYWAESTILLAQDVPINIYATFPGEARTKIGETVIDELTVGAPDFGSQYVFTTWKADREGIYVIEVEVDPSYSEENMLNNAATRAIIVGDLGQPWGAIEGQVREALGGADGVIMDLYNDDHTILIESKITNNGGYYLFTDLPAGTYKVHIRVLEGYAADAQTKPAEVVAQAITTVNFFLSQTAAPVADAGGPYSGEAGVPVTLDASGSHDPDGAIVLYEWDWDNDGTYDFTTTSPTCTHTWSTSFSGSVRMRVADDDGLSSIDTALVEIEGSGHEPVDDLTGLTFDNLRFDRRTGQSSVAATVTNTSTTTIGEPVWLVIEDISDPAVTLLGADGTTGNGEPYIDLTSLLGDGLLAPNESIETRIYFNNPTRQRFELDTSVYGMTTP